MIDGLYRAHVSLATKGRECSSPHLAVDVAAELHRRRDVPVKIVACDRCPFRATYRVDDVDVHVRDTDFVDEKGVWFVASKGNRMVRFVATAAAWVPSFGGVDATALLHDWTAQWPTRVLDEREMASPEAARLYVSRTTGNATPDIEIVKVDYLSEKAVVDAIQLLFTVPLG